MMLKRWMLVLGLLCPLLACATDAQLKPFSWRYGTGSNIDLTKNTKTEFYLGGKQVYADRLAGGGLEVCLPTVSRDSVTIGRAAVACPPMAFPSPIKP